MYMYNSPPHLELGLPNVGTVALSGPLCSKTFRVRSTRRTLSYLFESEFEWLWLKCTLRLSRTFAILALHLSTLDNI